MASIKNYLQASPLPFELDLFADELDFYVEEVENKIYTELNEHYYPTKRFYLLSRLMYDIGYLRLQKPLKIEVDLTSKVNRIIEQYTQFTNGSELFYNPQPINIVATTPTKSILVQGIVKRIDTTIGSTLYHKVKLGVKYDDISSVVCYLGDKELMYNQAFIQENSDYSLEVLPSEEMQIVFRKKNLKVGDNIRIIVITSHEPYHNTVRIQSLANDISGSNISISDRYEPPLTNEEMRDIILYNKNINNSLIYNEDYKNFILANVAGIDKIKVWHEDRQIGECAINKVFVSYIADKSLDDVIVGVIKEAVYGKVVTIVPPKIHKISIQLTIINNTNMILPVTILDEIKKSLEGYYIELTQHNIYRVIAGVLSRYNTDILLRVSTPLEVEMQSFFSIDYSDISINIVRRFS